MSINFLKHSYKLENPKLNFELVKGPIKTQCYLVTDDKKKLLHIFNLDYVLTLKNKTLELTTYKRNKPFFNTFNKITANLSVDLINGYSVQLKLFYIHFPSRFIMNSANLEIHNFQGKKTSIKIKYWPSVTINLIDNQRITLVGTSRIDVMNYFQTIKQKLKTVRDTRVFLDTVVLEK